MPFDCEPDRTARWRRLYGLIGVLEQVPEPLFQVPAQFGVVFGQKPGHDAGERVPLEMRENPPVLVAAGGEPLEPIEQLRLH